MDDLIAQGTKVKGFTDKDGKELDLGDEVTEGMYLVAVLEDEVVDNAPQTFDGILMFAGIGILGVGVLGIAAKKYLC